MSTNPESLLKIGPAYFERYSAKHANFCRVVLKVHKWALSSLELRDKIYKFFTRCRGIIATVNAHIDVTILHSVLECQCDKWREYVTLPHNWLPWEIGKNVQIDRLHSKRFHIVKKIAKIGPEDPEIVLRQIIKHIIFFSIKKKKLTQAKCMALPANLPSGLKYYWFNKQTEFTIPCFENKLTGA